MNYGSLRVTHPNDTVTIVKDSNYFRVTANGDLMTYRRDSVGKLHPTAAFAKDTWRGVKRYE